MILLIGFIIWRQQMSKIDLINNIEEPIDSPDPLPERYIAPKFPLDALGEILGEAAKRLAYHVQVPEGMAGQSVLAVASLVAQAYINVQRGDIGLGPVSLFLLSVAESGDRKSSVDRLALAPIREYEARRVKAMQEDLNRYKAAMEAWKMRHESIIKSSVKQGAEMTQDEQNRLSSKLSELETQKPKNPPRPNITFSEPTSEGIWKHYINGDPSAGLFSDEGISFFAGHGMSEEAKGRSIHMLSKLWDGDPISRTRGAEGESGILANRRLSSHLMIQPIIATKVLSDPLFQGQGFLARFLICHEPSIAGTRFLANRNISQGVHNDSAVGKYWYKITQLLNHPVKVDEETGELELNVSVLKDDVLALWSVIHDAIEDQIKPDGQYSVIKAFASKAAENAARIAAILSFVEGYEHPTLDHMERAGVLIAYYLDSMVIRTIDAQQDADEVLARDLLSWIAEHGRQLSATDFKCLPNSVRSSKIARKLLAFLVAAGYLRISETNSRTQMPSAWEVM